MFDLLQYLDQEAFTKIDYVTAEIGITLDELAEILELNPDLVWQVIKTGKIPPQLPNKEEVFEKFYLFLMLMSYLLNISDYKSSDLQQFWTDSSIYSSAIEKPPWYLKGLKDYLAQNKFQGLRSSIDWIKEY